MNTDENTGHDEIVLAVDSLDVSINPFGVGRVETVRDASLRLRRGEVVGLVGESGSGKTMLTRAVAGLLAPGLRPEVAGSVKVMGRELVGADAATRRRALRSDVSYVFQDPTAHLNPTMRIGEQIEEAIIDGARNVFELLESVGLPGTKDFSRLYPHQLSGGMKQRVIIACALAKNPGLIIADEPTTALDVTIQDQVLRLLKRLAHEENVAVLLVSHDLAAIGQFCSRMYVMYRGDLVEDGETEDILWRPQHEYTRSLMRAMRAIYDAPIASEGQR
ncbi:ABC transporter ATP-binding protein [Microbacterium sp. NPDC058342]|uniref:ABC transporter ATP-binding protein n=1 Tax=Microbacterium sp. NPDC058342 TaxID=3346454 RepID=UPI00364A6807